MNSSAGWPRPTHPGLKVHDSPSPATIAKPSFSPLYGIDVGSHRRLACGIPPRSEPGSERRYRDQQNAQDRAPPAPGGGGRCRNVRRPREPAQNRPSGPRRAGRPLSLRVPRRLPGDLHARLPLDPRPRRLPAGHLRMSAALCRQWRAIRRAVLQPRVASRGRRRVRHDARRRTAGNGRCADRFGSREQPHPCDQPRARLPSCGRVRRDGHRGPPAPGHRHRPRLQRSRVSTRGLCRRVPTWPPRPVFIAPRTRARSVPPPTSGTQWICWTANASTTAIT